MTSELLGKDGKLAILEGGRGSAMGFAYTRYMWTMRM